MGPVISLTWPYASILWLHLMSASDRPMSEGQFEVL